MEKIQCHEDITVKSAEYEQSCWLHNDTQIEHIFYGKKKPANPDEFTLKWKQLVKTETVITKLPVE
jgi:hypothetical protein